MLSSFFQFKKISDLTHKCVLPVMVLSIFLSFYLCVDMEKIQDKSQELVSNVVPNVLSTQQSAVRLARLKGNLERIIFDPDSAQVRQAYSDALASINEFHNHSNAYLSRNSVDLLFALNHLWKMRLQLDDMRESVHDSLHYMDTLLRFIALEDPYLFPEVIQLDSNYIELFHRNGKLPELLKVHQHYLQIVKQRREQIQAAIELKAQGLSAPAATAAAATAANAADGAQGDTEEEKFERNANVAAVVADILALENSYAQAQTQEQEQEHAQAQIQAQGEESQEQETAESSSLALEGLPVLQKQQRQQGQELAQAQKAQAQDADADSSDLDEFDWLYRYKELIHNHVQRRDNPHVDKNHQAAWSQTVAQMESLAAANAHTQRKADMLDSVVEKAIPEETLVKLATEQMSVEQAHKTQALVNDLLVLYENELTSLEPRWRLFGQVHNSFAYDSHRLISNVEQILKDYTLDESNLLQKSLKDISHLAKESLPMVMVTVGFGLLGFLLVNWMLHFYIIAPINVISHILIKFRHTKQISVDEFEHFATKRHLREINEIVEVLPHLFDDFSQMSAKSNVLEQRYDELLSNSQYDVLTKIFNRGQLEKLIKELGTQTPANFAVAMIDIDFFKKLNDTMGHQRGDEVLFAVAQTLQNHIAKGDRVFRYGGEEFCLILREITAVNAFNVANRLCKTIRELNLLNEGVPTNVVTVSIGISLITTSVGQFRVDELINQADKALYLAKRNGRNQVMACPRSLVVDLSEASSPKAGYKIAQRALEEDAVLEEASGHNEPEPREAALVDPTAIEVAGLSEEVVAEGTNDKAEAYKIGEMIKGRLAAAAFAKAEENLAGMADTLQQDAHVVAANDSHEQVSAASAASTAGMASAAADAGDPLSGDSAKARSALTATGETSETIKSSKTPESPKITEATASAENRDVSKLAEADVASADVLATAAEVALSAGTDGSKGSEVVSSAELNTVSLVERLRAKCEAMEQEERATAPAACALSPHHLSMFHAKEKLLGQISDPSVVSNNLAITAGALQQQTQRQQTAQERGLSVSGNSVGQQTTHGDNEEARQVTTAEALAQLDAAPAEQEHEQEQEQKQSASEADKTANSQEEFESAEISFTNHHYGEMGVNASGKSVNNLKLSPLLVTTAKGIVQEDIVEPSISPQELKQYAQRQTEQRWQAEQIENQKFEVTSEKDGGISIYIPAMPKKDD